MMREHSGDEMLALMDAMPAEAVATLQAAYPEHNITEREARWWGFLMVARGGTYETTEFTMTVGSTGQEWTQLFIDYVLSGRAADQRHGIVRKTWPDTDLRKSS